MQSSAGKARGLLMRRPNRSGWRCSQFDPVSTDWAACHAIGFDWAKIPQLREARALHSKCGDFPESAEELTVNWASTEARSQFVKELPVCRLKPPAGWDAIILAANGRKGRACFAGAIRRARKGRRSRGQCASSGCTRSSRTTPPPAWPCIRCYGSCSPAAWTSLCTTPATCGTRCKCFGTSASPPAGRGYDLVHAQYGSGCGFVASFVGGPRMLTLRGSDWFGNNPGNLGQRVHDVFAKSLSPLAMRRFRRVVVVSEQMRRLVVRDYPNTIVATLPSGINLDQFRPIDRIEARRLLGCEGDASPRILFSSVAGSASPAKRTPLARAGFQSLPQPPFGRADQVPDRRRPRPHPSLGQRLQRGVAHLDARRLAEHHQGGVGLQCSLRQHGRRRPGHHRRGRQPSWPSDGAWPESLANCLFASVEQPRLENVRRHAESMAVGEIAQRLIQVYQEACPGLPVCRLR